MKKVFISGSISIKELNSGIIESLENIISKNYKVLIGDAPGTDTLIQDFFSKSNYINVEIYSIFSSPRYTANKNFLSKYINVSSEIKNERERQTYKDEAMSNDSDFSFVIWDGKSKGSFANIKRAIENNKKLKVYYLLFDRCLEKDELSLKNLEDIYKSNTGYTSSEMLEKIKKLNIYTNISKVGELKSWFISQKIFNQTKNKIEINKNYKEYFIVENYRGSQTIKYKNDVLELLNKNSIFGALK